MPKWYKNTNNNNKQITEVLTAFVRAQIEDHHQLLEH